MVLLTRNAPAQEYSLILDSLVAAQQVYLDPLNQIYLIYTKEKLIKKFDQNFNLLWKKEVKYQWDNLQLDLSDPFKPILYFPGDYYLSLLDDRFTELNRIDEPLLHQNAILCRLNGNEYAVFDGNALTIRNNQTNQTRYSGILERPHSPDTQIKTKLKSNRSEIFLSFPGSGIVQFNDQLFKTQEWKIPELSHFDLADEHIFLFKNGSLYRFNVLDSIEKYVISVPKTIESLTANAERLAFLNSGRLTILQHK